MGRNSAFTISNFFFIVLWFFHKSYSCNEFVFLQRAQQDESNYESYVISQDGLFDVNRSLLEIWPSPIFIRDGLFMGKSKDVHGSI